MKSHGFSIVQVWVTNPHRLLIAGPENPTEQRMLRSLRRMPAFQLHRFRARCGGSLGTGAFTNQKSGYHTIVLGISG